jgi:branched-chain amino acid transport system permease protein
MGFFCVQMLNGLSWAMLLFLFTAGFTLIFGLMKLINLTHGTYFLYGGYIGLMVIYRTQSLFLSAVVGGIAIAILGIVMQRFLLYRYETSHSSQVLLTMGFLLFFADLALWIWGGEPKTIPVPVFLRDSIQLGSLTFPAYRLVLILVGLLTAALLWWFLKTTTFAGGAFLAGLAGVVGGPVSGIYPGVDLQILLLSLVIVIVGGMGSLKGAFIGSLLVGLLDTFIKALFPTFSLFAIFFIMAATLAIKPSGLFGTE